ncbi:MAG: hypothetical protein EOO61_19165, partial [Hymenobacter sp.]
LHELFEPLSDLLVNSFSNSFPPIGSLASNKKENKFKLIIKFDEVILDFQIKKNQLVLADVHIVGSYVAKKSESSYSTSVKAKQTNLYFITSNDVKEQLYDFQMAANMLDRLLNNMRIELQGVADKVYFLPASRSGLYQGLSNVGSLLAELSKNRGSTNKGVSLPNISEAVADYFLHLSTISYSEVVSPLAEVANQIEREILGGEVSFNEQDKKLYYKQQKMSQAIDISSASSMVSEMAPIIAYCKYILGGRLITYGRGKKRGTISKSYLGLYRNLLFIEEPEAHLHPEVQVKLMEFFARLTKHNVKVIMTSHSNYMFNKLSNLLLTDELEPAKVGSYLLRATPEGSVMDDFAMRAEEEGIADENFVDVAEQLYNERLAAYDKLNTTE